jgi:hypothetical protein
MARVTGRERLKWNGRGLFFGQRRIMTIEPDTVHASMFRVRRSDGSLTDLVNLTRAKDAATGIGLDTLNMKETAVGISPARFAVSAVSSSPVA